MATLGVANGEKLFHYFHRVPGRPRGEVGALGTLVKFRIFEPESLFLGNINIDFANKLVFILKTIYIF